MEPLKAHLSRFVCQDVAANLRRMEGEVEQASASGCGLCVFPESFLHGYTRPFDPREARAAFARVSSAHPQMGIVFGSISEDGRNRMTYWRAGAEVARYDKVHLFAPNGERDLWAEGDRYVAVRDQGWTFGLVNCNDLRFPEQARALRLEAGAQVLVVVAWWPWRRTHIFEALLRARAIENAAFVLGCCLTASEDPGERFCGAGTYAFDPLGEALPTVDDVTFRLDPARFREVVVDPVEGTRVISRVEVVEGER